MNQTLVQTLAKIINDRGSEDRWDEYLDSALLGTPSTWPAPRDDYMESDIIGEVANRVEDIKKLADEFRVEARRHVAQKQAEQKRRYDSHVAERPRFKLGEQVLMKDQVPPSKFANRWLGPMLVTKVNKNGTYWLDGPKGRRLEGAVNGDCLIPFHAKKNMVPDVQVTRAAQQFDAWISRLGI
jgi:hypothetical protein